MVEHHKGFSIGMGDFDDSAVVFDLVTIWVVLMKIIRRFPNLSAEF